MESVVPDLPKVSKAERLQTGFFLLNIYFILFYVYSFLTFISILCVWVFYLHVCHVYVVVMDTRRGCAESPETVVTVVVSHNVGVRT